MGWFVARQHLDWRCIQSQKRDVIYFSVAESLQHVLKKAEVCYELKKMGHWFYTEAVFKNNLGRADIYDITENKAIEIVHSEDVTKTKKESRYPCLVEYVRVASLPPLQSPIPSHS